ncbi:hypothetical protein BGZ73_002045, partial [Actinomortierella ambigua]
KEPWHKARYEFKHKKRSIKKVLGFDEDNFATADFGVHATDDPSFETISRLEYSREAHYLAALVILKDAVKIQVWNIHDVRKSPNENIANRGAMVTIEHKHARHLTI